MFGYAIMKRKNADKSFTRFLSGVSTYQRVQLCVPMAFQELHKIQISFSRVKFGTLFTSLLDTKER